MRSLRHRLYARPAVSTVVAHRDPRWLRWLKRLVMSLGTITLLMFLVGLLTRCGTDRVAALPQKFILTAQFTGAWNEAPDRLAFFAPPEEDFYNVLATLREGARDPKVKALIVHIWNGQYSLSQIKEIRAALNEWRAAGKVTYAYSNSLGDGATGMGAYWLATAFDKIWVQDLGFVTMNGFRAEIPFARGALEKLGVRPEFFAYTTYKSAMDMFSRSSITEADRKQLTVMLNGLNDDFITDVSAARALPIADIRKAIAGAPYMAADAAKLKLIDQTGYGDELGERVRLGLQDDNLPFISILDYMPQAIDKNIKKDGKTKVAMINIEGEITDAMIMPEEAQGQGGGVLSGGGELCVSCAILAASDDENIKAILLRVNTPGGSPTASGTIRRAMIVARSKGKKVIVSMGDVAASGGYWIASGADKIIAYPTTITGSIGVVGGKFAAQEFFSKYGVNFDEVSSDVKAPNMGSFITPFSAEAAARQKKNLQAIYDAFKERVAKGRNIKDVESIAQGRVWLGKDAVKIGLVDQLGGLDVAKNTLACILRLKSTADIVLIPYMPQASPLEGLKKLLGLPGVVVKLQNEWMKISAALNAQVQAKADLPVILN